MFVDHHRPNLNSLNSLICEKRTSGHLGLEHLDHVVEAAGASNL